MNINKLEKATKIYEKIKSLDAQIIEIEKFAMLVANGETKSSFELKCDDLLKKNENDEKVSFDSDGSLIKGRYSEYTRSIFEMCVPRFSEITADKKNENEIVLKDELSVKAVMSILGILLCEKQERRDALIGKLKNLGVYVLD